MHMYWFQYKILRYLYKEHHDNYFHIHDLDWVGPDYFFQYAVEGLREKGLIECGVFKYDKSEIYKKTICKGNDHSGLVREWIDSESKNDPLTGNSLLIITQDGLEYYKSLHNFWFTHWVPYGITTAIALSGLIISIISLCR